MQIFIQNKKSMHCRQLVSSVLTFKGVSTKFFVMNFTILFGLCLIVHSAFTFRNFEHGKDYIFKFEWKKSGESSVDPQKMYMKFGGHMYVRRVNDTGLLFKFDKTHLDGNILKEITKDFETPFLVEIVDHKVQSITTSGHWTNNILDLKFEIIRDFIKDYKSFTGLNVPENIFDTIDLELPFGHCNATVKISIGDSKTYIKAKARKFSCVMSEEFIKRHFDEDERFDPKRALANDSENGIKIEVSKSDKEIKELVLFHKIHATVHFSRINIRISDKMQYEFKRVEDATVDIPFMDHLV